MFNSISLPNMKLILIATAIAWVLTYNETYAQCLEPAMIIDTSGALVVGGGSPLQVGSSFSACMDGEVTHLSLNFHSSNPSATGVLIFRDIAKGGILGSVGATKEYAQLIQIEPGGGIQTFKG